VCTRGSEGSGDIPERWATRASFAPELTGNISKAMFPLVLGFAFWVWSAFITFGAGFVGAALNCEHGCSHQPVQWAKPWTLGNHYVYPEVFIIGLIGFAAASLAVLFIRRRQPVHAAALLMVSLLLLSYPYFAGLTSEGRRLLWFGPLLGAAALAVSIAQSRARDANT
jgi:hypothetical protein